MISSGLRNSPYYRSLKEKKEKELINGVYSIDDPYLYDNF